MTGAWRFLPDVVRAAEQGMPPMGLVMDSALAAGVFLMPESFGKR